MGVWCVLCPVRGVIWEIGEGGKEGGREITFDVYRVYCIYTVSLSNPDTLGTEESVLISEVS